MAQLLVKWLPCIGEPEFNLQNWFFWLVCFKKPWIVVYAYNPSAGEAETGGSLGLTGHAAQPTWKVPIQLETLPQNQGGNQRRGNGRGYTYQHEHTHTFTYRVLRNREKRWLVDIEGLGGLRPPILEEDQKNILDPKDRGYFKKRKHMLSFDMKGDRCF